LVFFFHNITNISKTFEITKFLGKFFRVGVFHQKKGLNSKRKNFLENSWTTSPPLITSKHPQREGG